MSEFSVDFTYSEFIPIKNNFDSLVDAIVGDTGTSIIQGVDNLF